MIQLDEVKHVPDECCDLMNEHSNQFSTNDLTACQEKLAKSEEQYRYLQADFENFRRNMAKERVYWTNTAQIKIFEDLLPVIDDFARAVEDYQKQSDSFSEIEKARFTGIELVYKNFLKFLSANNIVEVPTNVPFNPRMHEALMQVVAEDKKTGEVVAVLQKGYMRNDVVIRPAKVSVAQ